MFTDMTPTLQVSQTVPRFCYWSLCSLMQHRQGIYLPIPTCLLHHTSSCDRTGLATWGVSRISNTATIAATPQICTNLCSGKLLGQWIGYKLLIWLDVWTLPPSHSTINLHVSPSCFKLCVNRSIWRDHKPFKNVQAVYFFFVFPLLLHFWSMQCTIAWEYLHLVSCYGGF